MHLPARPPLTRPTPEALAERNMRTNEVLLANMGLQTRTRLQEKEQIFSRVQAEALADDKKEGSGIDLEKEE